MSGVAADHVTLNLATIAGSERIMAYPNQELELFCQQVQLNALLVDAMAVSPVAMGGTGLL